MNLERQKEQFRNHVATFTDYGNIKILDFANPESSNYRIRFLFEEDYCRLHISGDLGELIATNYNNMRFEKFGDFVNNIGYFEEKINCHSRAIVMHDEDLAKQQLKERIKEDDLLTYTTKYDWCEDEDARIEEILDDVFYDFSDHTGVGSKGYDTLCDLDCDAFEWASELGKKDTGILELYMLAFKLAMEQIEAQHDAISPINTEPEAISNEWIYCNERLPETTDTVLIATGYGVVLVAFYGTNKTWRYGSGKKVDSQDEPIAWMPMPQFVFNQVEQEHNNGWIPCSERLPEVGETVLISPKDKHKGVTSSTYGTYDIAYLTLKDKGIFKCAINGEYKFDEVWAWQPLPPTYTEK